jgi:hypothetical protein
MILRHRPACNCDPPGRSAPGRGFKIAKWAVRTVANPMMSSGEAGRPARLHRARGARLSGSLRELARAAGGDKMARKQNMGSTHASMARFCNLRLTLPRKATEINL